MAYHLVHGYRFGSMHLMQWRIQRFPMKPSLGQSYTPFGSSEPVARQSKLRCSSVNCVCVCDASHTYSHSQAHTCACMCLWVSPTTVIVLYVVHVLVVTYICMHPIGPSTPNQNTVCQAYSLSNVLDHWSCYFVWFKGGLVPVIVFKQCISVL